MVDRDSPSQEEFQIITSYRLLNHIISAARGPVSPKRFSPFFISLSLSLNIILYISLITCQGFDLPSGLNGPFKPVDEKHSRFWFSIRTLSYQSHCVKLRTLTRLAQEKELGRSSHQSIITEGYEPKSGLVVPGGESQLSRLSERFTPCLEDEGKWCEMVRRQIKPSTGWSERREKKIGVLDS